MSKENAGSEGNEERTIEITNVPEIKEETFSEEGLTAGEKELAKEHGFTEDKKEDKEDKEEKKDKEDKKDGEHEEQSETKAEEDKEEKKEELLEDEEEKSPTFDEVEKDEKNLKKFTPNEQALYFKWKLDKKKRQKAVNDFETLKAESELNTVKNSAYGKKLKKIQEKLDSGEEVSVEDLQTILGGKTTEDDDDSKAVTQGDLKKIKETEEKETKEIRKLREEYSERIQSAEEIGIAKYGKKEFDRISELANEVKDQDKTGTYKSVLEGAFSDKDVDEVDLVERVVTIAKLHPKFGKENSEESEEEEEPKKDTKAARAIKNSKKKINSASIGGGGGKRTLTHSELTADDADNLTTKQWMELPDDVRERLLAEA